MNTSYFHEKLSLAVFEIFTGTQNLKGRLRSSLLKHPFVAFPVEMAPEDVREQFSEIKAALAGRLRDGGSLENYPDAIDRMKHADVQRLFKKIFVVYEGVTKEYHRRRFQG